MKFRYFIVKACVKILPTGERFIEPCVKISKLQRLLISKLLDKYLLIVKEDELIKENLEELENGKKIGIVNEITREEAIKWIIENVFKRPKPMQKPCERPEHRKPIPKIPKPGEIIKFVIDVHGVEMVKRAERILNILESI